MSGTKQDSKALVLLFTDMKKEFASVNLTSFAVFIGVEKCKIVNAATDFATLMSAWRLAVRQNLDAEIAHKPRDNNFTEHKRASSLVDQHAINNSTDYAKMALALGIMSEMYNSKQSIIGLLDEAIKTFEKDMGKCAIYAAEIKKLQAEIETNDTENKRLITDKMAEIQLMKRTNDAAIAKLTEEHSSEADDLHKILDSLKLPQ